MKLLTQTNRRYLLISLVAMVISSAVLFKGVRGLFDNYADERLLQLEEEVIAYVHVQDTLPVFFQSMSARLVAEPTEKMTTRSLTDTTLLNDVEQEEEPFRRLRFGIQLHGKPFQIEILQSAVETEDIAETVLMLNLGLMVAMFLALFWAQTRMSEQLWKPFYLTLDRLRAFTLAQPEPLALVATQTDEFTELNTTLERLTEKTRQDYHSLKRFTENASHEIQTPLAIIRAKLDMLLQSEGLSPEQLAQLHQTQQAAARLSRLQQNLLLLVKIENDQFQAMENIDLKLLVERKLEQLEDFFSAKQVTIRTELTSVPKLLDLFLAETLIGNLIGNALKHNLASSGWIAVALSERALIVRNSGLPPEVPPFELMERFRRSSAQSDGLGLGLAIVQEICEQYGWGVDVGFTGEEWVVEIKFTMNIEN